MSRVVKYAAACVGLVGSMVLLGALLLDRSGWIGMSAAAAIALPVQIVLFVLMSRARAGTNAFLGAWVGGMLARLVVVGLVLLALERSPGFPEAPTLLGLVAFFFMMVLMEPLFLGLRTGRSTSELRRE